MLLPPPVLLLLLIVFSTLIHTLFFSPIFAVSCLLFFVIVHYGIVLREERYMLRFHGDDYLCYQQSVRLWL